MFRTAFLISLLCIALPALALPSYKQVRANYTSSNASLLDRHNEVIQQLRVDSSSRRFEWTPLTEISPVLINALIQAEDKRFYKHTGVDWVALSNAAFSNVFKGTHRGASTISMQLAAILDPSLKPIAGKRSITEKWHQILAAKELEGTWNKKQILEAYLNLVYFHGELQGITAASHILFDKAPSGIDSGEAVVLIVLLRSPQARNEQVTARACALANSIALTAGCERIKAITNHALGASEALADDSGIAPFVARKLLKLGTTGVVSTIDAPLQRYALDALRYQLSLLNQKNVSDGAVLVVDNASGDVLAYIGNSGNTSSAQFVDGVMALRQPGSALKPFLYELAIERHLITAASLLNDSPVNLMTPTGLYVPQDYDREFKGLVSARVSLASSLNVPAVRTLMLTGVDSFVGRLRELGFSDIKEDGDYYGYALALGAPEVRLWQLVNAYRVLANGGVAGNLTLIPNSLATPQSRIMDESAAYIISDILSDRGARSVSFGLENPLATRFWAAAKTGTSKDMRDNWCIGYSQRYTVGVWVGNFSGASMWNVSGISGAAPLWLDIMNYLHQSEPSLPPQRPNNISVQHVVFGHGIEPARDELFLANATLTGAHTSSAISNSKPHIVYPGNGMIIAIDPDIPISHQRVRFELQSGEPGYMWRLDGHQIGEVGKISMWKPTSGQHELVITDASGNQADKVRFEVRGGPNVGD